jgi:NADH dehydrogenase FAD-containing subunit
MRLVLVGAGHGHLHALGSLRRIVARGHATTLVAPEPFWYSGLATGVLGGRYPAALDRIDVAATARAAGAMVAETAAVSVDVANRTLGLADGRSIGWDVLSIAVGSAPPPLPGSADNPAVHPVKPVARLLALRTHLERAFAEGRMPRVAVAGGGATAVEVAANLAALAARAGARIAVTILAGAPPLARLPPGARDRVLRSLDRAGVAVRTGARVLRVEGREAVLATGGRIAFDHLVNATGLVPNPLHAATGLPLDETGALRVDRFLRSVGDPAVHGAGDGVTVEGHHLDKVGVYAIRQGPVLTANLKAALEGGPPVPFRPQRRYLWILNLGDGTGLAMRGGLWWHGRAAFLLKDLIDRRFLAANRPPAAP